MNSQARREGGCCAATCENSLQEHPADSLPLVPCLDEEHRKMAEFAKLCGADQALGVSFGDEEQMAGREASLLGGGRSVPFEFGHALRTVERGYMISEDTKDKVAHLMSLFERALTDCDACHFMAITSKLRAAPNGLEMSRPASA